MTHERLEKTVAGSSNPDLKVKLIKIPSEETWVLVLPVCPSRNLMITAEVKYSPVLN